MRTTISSSVPAHIAERKSDRSEYDDYMDDALESVVEDILTFGQYPRPHKGRIRPPDFDLQDWMTEHYDPADLANLAMCAVIDYGNDFAERRLKEYKRLEQRLLDELRDHDFVYDVARDMACEAKE